MNEQPIFKPEIVEAEIAELNRQIEERRATLEKNLEREKGVMIESAEESVHKVLAETIRTEVGTIPETTFGAGASKSAASYLESLDEAQAAELNTLIQKTFEQGIAAAVKDLPSHSPFLIEAYHKILTEQLTAELKNRGLLK
jgi:hypothetical protein